MTPNDLARIHERAMTSRPWTAAEFADLLQSTHIILVARPSGFALGRAVADEAELLTIAVTPDAQRQGEGRRLLRTFQTEAAARGATHGFLDVAADNAPALALYLAEGWQATARRSGYYARPGAHPQDAILMCKSLSLD